MMLEFSNSCFCLFIQNNYFVETLTVVVSNLKFYFELYCV